VGGIPLNDHPHGFMVIAGLIGLFTAFAGWYLYRQK
jgi:zinc transporter